MRVKYHCTLGIMGLGNGVKLSLCVIGKGSKNVFIFISKSMQHNGWLCVSAEATLLCTQLYEMPPSVVQ